MSNNDNWFSTPEVEKSKKIKKPNNKVKRKMRFTLPTFEKSRAKIKKISNDKPLLKKILYTLLLILIFRIGSTITMPGVTLTQDLGSDQGSLLGILDLMGGGALKRFSIFALGISPYITSSIIMQMLNSEAFPPLHRLGQSGPAGKRKINVITRVLTLIFAYIQGVAIIQSVGQSGLSFDSAISGGMYKFVIMPLILIAGSVFALFVGEQITANGVGNGTSLIIFSGIAATLPTKFQSAWNGFVSTGTEGSTFIGIMNFVLYTLVFIVMVFVIGYFYKAERHVPIQQTGSGMTKDVKQMSRLPIKLNPAGVMPVIFALTISMLPLTIAQFLDHQNLTGIWIKENMKMTAPLGLGLLVGVNFLFTIVMSLVTFKPNDVADNFKKNGTFIPGVRPGDETEEYLTGIIVRLSVFSAIYLSLVVAVQYIEQIIVPNNPNITLSGTSIIILVTVAIETIGQLKARDQTNKISRQRKASVASVEGNTTGGLLW